MKRKVLTLALLGMGIGLAGAARADLAGGLAAYEGGRCDEAVSALTPVAEAGDAAAQTALGDIYMNLERRCQDRTRNARKAEPWYLLAARSGDAKAQRQLITIYDFEFRVKDRVQSTKWYASLAALGRANDLYELATRYQRAEGVTYDRVLAHAFFLLASRRPEKAEGVDMSTILERGAAEMSPEQLAEAESIATAWKVGAPLPTTSVTGRNDPRDWYKARAEKGDIEAAYKLGTLYWKSDYGLSVDPKLAVFWLSKAGQGGIADAQYQLSRFYSMGYGVPKDYVLGYALHRLAIQGGGKEALQHKDAWDDTLTEQQLDEANALIAQWKKGDALPQASRHGMQRKVNYVEHARGELAPTPAVLALFKAASEGREAEFTRLLAKVDHLNDYLVDGEKLVHVLLQPAASLRDEADDWRRAEKDGRDTAHWKAMQARHAALLPAKTRMLALALQRGASIDEGTSRDNAAPLHLAAMFGTPEMVRMLLKQGADPRQFGGQSNMLAPLEFALEQKDYGRSMPELITPEQRTGNILALLQAGAPRPYIRYDIESSRRNKGEDKNRRPHADYRLWPAALSLTRGTAVLDALVKTGTSPVDGGGGKTAFGFAAEAGNADAIAWLKQRLQRYDTKKRDLWLDAAMLAMYSNAPDRDRVLGQLLVKDMDWKESGPQRDSLEQHLHRTLYAGSAQVEDGTLLNHATRAHRFEWIPKLATLGAPVNTGGSQQDLVNAAREGDAGSVKALLAQGANPLGGYESVLSLALAAPGGKDDVLDLLLDHIVRVQKKSLAELRESPLEEVLTAANTIGTARVRKLINAGASVQDLSNNAIEAAFSAPDRGVAALLIQRGLLGKAADAKAATRGAPRFLFVAIRTNRADLLPAILAHGEQPNRRNELENGRVQPSPVEYAISQGNMEALKVLLAHGGVIDTSTRMAWGTALDRAVASLNPDMLRKVSRNFSLPLKQVCLESNVHLAKVVLEAPASYWELLREHGFYTGGVCDGKQGGLALYLSGSPDLLEGWIGQRLTERLPQLGARREPFQAETWTAITASQNAPLERALARAGWTAPASAALTEEKTAPPPQNAADLALQGTLSGHYYLSGVTEVGAEILLRPNGKFQYSMAYGAVDEYAQGNWKVADQQVVFRSESASMRAASMRPSTEGPPATVAAGQVLVEMRYHGKSIPGFKVALLGDAPVKAEGRTGAHGWRTAFSAPVRQIAVSHPEVNDSKWMVYTVPAADARRGSYQLDFEPPQAPQTRFNATLAVRDGSLMMKRGGRELLFEKH